MLSLERQTRLAELQYQLTLATDPQRQTIEGSVSASLSTKEQVKADIDDLVASECLYCGELMIE